MIRKIQKVELQASANAVIRGEVVTLTANLSDLELESIRERNGGLEYRVGDSLADADSADSRLARWKTDVGPGEYPVTVTLVIDGKRQTISETKVHVLALRREQQHLELQLEMIPREVEEGEEVALDAVSNAQPGSLEKANLHYDWVTDKGTIVRKDFSTATWDTTGAGAGTQSVTARLVDEHGRVVETTTGPMTVTGSARIRPSRLGRGDVLRVALQRPAATRTRDQAFWSLIRSCTAQISTSRYADFIERVLCPEDASFVGRRSVIVNRLSRDARDLQTFTYGVGAYEVLKAATQIFLLLECGGCHAEIKNLDIDDESARFGEPVTLDELRRRLSAYLASGHLPYIDRVLDNAFRGEKQITGMHCYGVLSSRIQVPCLLELIWSYWHEEGMLVQSIGAIARRFQNVRAPGDRDPLAHLEIDPLRPLGNLLWGYIQDEQNLLTVKRRAYEYDHQYGLALYGKAVPALRPADSRSKFLEAFHHLLHRCSIFYKEDNDTTVIADGFALLNALQEVHLLLAEGAHNQFGDLPWTARAEMLMQQWLLARPEMRDFLQGRRMVPYKEPWMAQVDTMKALQGWTDIPVTHFRDLGVYGEQILLTIRYGDWIDINNEDAAKNWARSWRPEIQGYLHAYRAVTGMDLTSADMVDHTMPAIHLQKRLAMQRAR
jgi:hypothetical protein